MQRCSDGCGEVVERNKKIKRRKRGGELDWEFRNLSSINISTSAISMQMVARMNDGKAMSRASFSVTLL